MRIHSLILYAALAAAQAQQPLGEQLQSWFEKAKSFIPQAVQAPIDAGASAVAAHTVTELTTTNWDTVLAPRLNEKTGTYGPDNWMVLVTGGNRTCQGKCDLIGVEFNKTAALFSTEKDVPHMGLINCDNYGVLCSIWFAGPPALWYIQVPQQIEGERHETPIHVFHLNLTTTTTQTFTSIHREKKYLNRPKIDSVFHPFDGQLALWGINKPVGYTLFTFSMIPSWSLMLVVSFMTRSFMSSRVGNPGAGRSQGNTMANRPLGGAPSAAG